jgi:hypothetical protein
MVDLGWHAGKRRRKFLYGRTRAEVAKKLVAEAVNLGETDQPGNC